MRRLCLVQVVCALLAWFYGTKLSLLSYPGAFSVMVDGPFRTKADCEEALEYYKEMADHFGINVTLTKCYERKQT
jgi:hypothetical protein